MAKVKVQLAMDKGEIKALTSAPGRPVLQLANTMGRRVVASAKQRAPVASQHGGTLRNSITQGPLRVEGERVTFTVSADTHYATYVHEGTPARIYPKNAKMLRFEIGGRVIYAKSVRGMKARPFLLNALKEVAPTLGFRIE